MLYAPTLADLAALGSPPPVTPGTGLHCDVAAADLADLIAVLGRRPALRHARLVAYRDRLLVVVHHGTLPGASYLAVGIDSARCPTRSVRPRVDVVVDWRSLVRTLDAVIYPRAGHRRRADVTGTVRLKVPVTASPYLHAQALAAAYGHATPIADRADTVGTVYRHHRYQARHWPRRYRADTFDALTAPADVVDEVVLDADVMADVRRIASLADRSGRVSVDRVWIDGTRGHGLGLHYQPAYAETVWDADAWVYAIDSYQYGAVPVTGLGTADRYGIAAAHAAWLPPGPAVLTGHVGETATITAGPVLSVSPYGYLRATGPYDGGVPHRPVVPAWQHIPWRVTRRRERVVVDAASLRGALQFVADVAADRKRRGQQTSVSQTAEMALTLWHGRAGLVYATTDGRRDVHEVTVLPDRARTPSPLAAPVNDLIRSAATAGDGAAILVAPEVLATLLRAMPTTGTVTITVPTDPGLGPVTLHYDDGTTAAIMPIRPSRSGPFPTNTYQDRLKACLLPVPLDVDEGNA